MKNTVLKRTLSGFALSAVLLGACPSYAHFLWAEIDAKPQPSLHLTLAEAAGEMTTGVSLDRLKAARAWDGAGKVLATAPDGATLAAPVATDFAAAQQTWGVLDKSEGGRGVFLLQYYAKAARSVEAAAQDARLPLELFLRRDQSTLVATLKHNGKPVPLASVKLHEPDADKPRDLTTDAAGVLRFPAAKPGLYGLRAAVAETKKGAHEGKPYDLIRHYSTLTFTVAATPATTTLQPVALETGQTAGNAKADPAAYALLEGAHNSRQVMPADFPGFDAQVTFKNGPQSATGTLRYRRGEKTVLEIADLSADDKAWFEDQILSIIGHRRGGDFAKGDGRHPLSFGNAPENYYGKLIELNDAMGSSYRVRDNKVTEVTRTAGDSRFTISVLETMEANPGKYLSNHFVVSYRDKNTGALQKVEGFRDSYAQIGGVWLPASRLVVTFGSETSPHACRIGFKDIKLLEAAKVAATK